MTCTYQGHCPKCLVPPDRLGKPGSFLPCTPIPCSMPRGWTQAGLPSILGDLSTGRYLSINHTRYPSPAASRSYEASDLMVNQSSCIWTSKNQCAMSIYSTKPPYQAVLQGHYDTLSRFRQGTQEHLSYTDWSGH